MTERPTLIITCKAVAREAGVSTRTIKRWVAAGRLPAKKPGGRTSPYRVRATDLDRLLGREGER